MAEEGHDDEVLANEPERLERPISSLPSALSGPGIHWSVFDHGGHFAAHKVRDLLVPDVRKFFRALR